MNYRQLFQKSRSVSLKSLFIILTYKLAHAIVIAWEKKFGNSEVPSLALTSIDSLREKIPLYYLLLNNQKNIVQIANEVLDNQITIFGTKFKISDSAWLQDPISKKQWKGDVFFTDAKVEEEGLGDVKYVMELNKMYHIVVLAQAYYETEDIRYIDRIKQQILCWRKVVKYEHSVINKSMLDIIYICYNLIHVSMICYNNLIFQKDIFPNIIEILILSERQIRKFETPRWCKYSTGANHTIGEMAGLITTQQFLQYFARINYDKYLEAEYKYLHKSLNNIITKEGVYLEQSANYTKLVAEFLMLLDIFVQSMGTEKCRTLYDDKYIRLLLQYVNILSYKEILPNFGDNDGAKAAAPFYQSRDSVNHLNKFLNYRFPNTKKKNNLICYESGQFIWKSPNNDFYLFTRCGKHSFLPLGNGSHAHNDILAILLGVKGWEVFIDSGTYYYNSGIDIINQDRATTAHNTVTFDNLEQGSFAGKWLYGSYPNSQVGNNISIENGGFVFSGICNYENCSHKRELSYKNNVLDITDNLRCEVGTNISLNFLLSPKVSVSQDNQQLKFHVNNTHIATMLCDPNVEILIKIVTYHPSYGVSEQTTKVILHSKIKGSQELNDKIIIL